MEIFSKVVEGSSFAAAARHFRISPAMVSKHIRAIEEHLGVRLLNRTSRRVTPTEIGQDYYERCLRILGEIEQAERAAGDLNTTPRGQLRVSASYAFGTSHLAPAIARYLAAYPEVAVELALSDRFVDLIEEGFDVAVRIGHLPDSSLIARRLTSTSMVLCASPTYLERHGTPLTVGDLAEHNCLTYSLSKTRNDWPVASIPSRTKAIHISGRFTANSGEALRILALAGEGIVRLPWFIVEADLASGRLLQLLPDHETSEIPVNAVYPSNRFMSAKVRAFVDFIVGHFAESASQRPSTLFAATLHPLPGLHAV
jgi:DNA-binding transcriptional LysR family regulator